MLSFKQQVKKPLLFALCFLLSVVSSAFAPREWVNAKVLYILYMWHFLLMIVWYYFIFMSGGELKNKLYRFKDLKTFRRKLYLQFTVMNFFYTLFIFIGFCAEMLLLGNIYRQELPLLLYPVNYFMAFQVVALFCVALAPAKRMDITVLAVLFCVFILYFIAHSTPEENIAPWNLFYPLLNGRFDLSTVIQYAGWNTLGLLYLYQKGKRVEL